MFKEKKERKRERRKNVKHSFFSQRVTGRERRENNTQTPYYNIIQKGNQGRNNTARCLRPAITRDLVSVVSPSFSGGRGWKRLFFIGLIYPVIGKVRERESPVQRREEWKKRWWKAHVANHLTSFVFLGRKEIEGMKLIECFHVILRKTWKEW